MADNQVWIPDSDATFVRGTVVLEEDGTVAVRRDDTGEQTRVPAASMMQCNPAQYDRCADMAELTHLNEPSVVNNLELRYNDGNIYTYSGLFLVAVNPYQRLLIFDDNYLEMYSGGGLLSELPPHIYAITERTYRNMRSRSKNQSILVTGESGAGKTENTKRIIQYLSSIAKGRAESSAPVPQAAQHASIEDKILQANPILEAFGNAQTVRNNNSSRFGKFIRIQFDEVGRIAGATIDWYLLEKLRVVHQSTGTDKERNYHVFYQMLAGLSKSRLASMGLAGNRPREYAYLEHTNPKIPGVDDKAEHALLVELLRIMGFSDEEQNAVFETLATVLLLGNIGFSLQRGDQAHFAKEAPVVEVCKLAGITSLEFSTAILRPKVKAGKEWVTRTQLPQQARALLDSLAKTMYEELFRFLVDKINERLVGDVGPAVSFIGVLDIAGFEIFGHNLFEQLCINYTNERLQQFFNHHMFILEQNEYLKEQIAWKFVDFGNDLKPTIELIENTRGGPGVLALLDEECIVPKASDQLFLDKLVDQWGTPAKKEPEPGTPHTKFSQNKIKLGFIIHHYAGKVDYSVDGWLDKNRDPLSDAIVELFQKSSNDFVSGLFTSYAEQKGVSSARRQTVGSKHKKQLLELMSQLGSTNPQFVRCILPNANKQPRQFDQRLVLHQLRCNGVLEGIRIARAGYPNRIVFAQFFERYQILHTGSTVFGTNAKANCELVLRSLKLDPESFKVGLTKLFFKNGVLADLEARRETTLHTVITQFQLAVRGNLRRRHLKEELARMQAALVLVSNLRTYQQQLSTDPWFQLYVLMRPMLAPDSLAAESKKHQARVRLLELQIGDLTKEKQQLELENARLALELALVQQALALERELLADKDQALQAVKQREVELQQQLAELQQQLEQVQQQLEELLLVAREREQQKGDAAEALAAQQALHERMVAQVAELEELLRQAVLARDNAERARALTQLRLDECEADRLQMRATVAQQAQQMAELKKQAQEAKRVLQQTTTDAARSRDTLSADVSRLKAEASGLAVQVERLQAAQRRLQAEMAEKDKVADGMRQAMAAHERTLDESVKKAQRQAKECASAQRDLRDCQQQLAQAESRSKEHEREARAATAKLREKATGELELRKAAEKHQLEVARVQEELRQAQELAQTHRQELVRLEQAKRTLEGLVLEHTSQLARLEREVVAAKEARVVAEREVAAAKDARSAAERELSQSKRLSVLGSSLRSLRLLVLDETLLQDYTEVKLKLSEQTALVTRERMESRRLQEELLALKTRLALELYDNRRMGQALRSLMAVPEDSGSAEDKLRAGLQRERADKQRAELRVLQLEKELRETREVATPSVPPRTYLDMSRSPSMRVVLPLGDGANSVNNGSSHYLVMLRQARDELGATKKEVLRLRAMLAERDNADVLQQDRVRDLERRERRLSMLLQTLVLPPSMSPTAAAGPTRATDQLRAFEAEEEAALLRLEVEALEHKQGQLQLQVSLYLNRAEEYQRRLEQAEMTVRTAQRLEQVAQRELLQAREALSVVERELDEVRRLTSSVRWEADLLAVLMKEQQANASLLEALVALLTKELTYYKRQLHQQAGEYTREIQGLREELGSKLAAETSWGKERKRLELAVELASEELAALKLELAQQQRAKTAVDRLVAEAQLKVSGLEQEAERTRVRLQAAELSAGQLERRVGEVTQERDAAVAAKLELEQRMARVSEEYQQHVVALLERQAELVMLRDQLEHERGVVQQTRRRFEEADLRANTLAARLDLIAEELALNAEENTAYKQLNQKLADKVRGLEQQVYDGDKNEFWEEQVRGLNRRLEEARAEAAQQLKQLAEHERRATELEIRLETQTRLAEKYHQELFGMEQKMGQLQDELAVARVEQEQAQLAASQSARETRTWREKALVLEKESLEWRNKASVRGGV